MSQLVPFNEMQLMAESACKSNLFGMKTPDQALALMMLCQAENLHPAIALRDYHLIQGRPALKADAMLARFQQAGGSVQWKTYTDEQVTGVFSHPQGGSLELTWTIQQARSIGIAGKDNWKNYPRAMLRARCISEGIRSVYPGCVVGVYTPEEVEDFKPVVKDMGQAEVVNPSTGEIQAPVEAVLKAFYLHVPGNPEPFNSYDTPEEWIVGYAKLVQRITMSEKLSEEQKQDKLKSLAEVNKEVTAKFDSFQKTKLRTAIIQNGGTSNPKPETSPSSTALELSDSEF